MSRYLLDTHVRLLIAQAVGARLTFLTADDAMRPYDVDLVWVG